MRWNLREVAISFRSFGKSCFNNNNTPILVVKVGVNAVCGKQVIPKSPA